MYPTVSGLEDLELTKMIPFTSTCGAYCVRNLAETEAS